MTIGVTTDPGTTAEVTSVGPGTADGATGATGATGTSESTGPDLWRDFPEHCSAIEQDCPPGYKCMPYGPEGGSPWIDTKCSPIVKEPDGPGELCTVVDHAASGDDSCDGTSMCWDVDPKTNQGACVPFCVGTDRDPYCANRCDRCVLGQEGALAICLPTCDPVIQNCPEGQGCYPFDNYFTCAPVAARDAMLGSPCEYLNGCPPGLACVESATVPGCDEGVPGCCTSICAVGGIDPCTELLPGSTCTEVFEEGGLVPEGCLTAPVGVCVM